MYKFLTVLICTMLLTVSLAGCDRDGPAEELGESIDNTIDDAADSGENLADEIEEEY